MTSYEKPEVADDNFSHLHRESPSKMKETEEEEEEKEEEKQDFVCNKGKEEEEKSLEKEAKEETEKTDDTSFFDLDKEKLEVEERSRQLLKSSEGNLENEKLLPNGKHQETVTEKDGVEVVESRDQEDRGKEKSEKIEDLMTKNADKDINKDKGDKGNGIKSKNDIKAGMNEDKPRRNSLKNVMEMKRTTKETKGEGHSRVITPAAPKKMAQKVNSIVEDYTMKIKSSTSTKPEVGDKATPRKGIRRSETETKGHISEIREKIERNASSVQSPRTPRGGSAVSGKDGGTNDGSGVPLEEKRRKKADEWMNKVVKSSTESGAHSPSLVSSSSGKTPTNTWKKREEDSKKEKEQREVAQKQLEEKRKKLEEERRLARETTSKRQKEQEPTETTKREQVLCIQKSPSAAATDKKETAHSTVADRYTRSLQSQKAAKSSPIAKNFSSTDEDESAKKQKVLESRIRPLYIEDLDSEGLRRKVQEMHERITALEEEKYDLEVLLEKRDAELNELRVRTGEAKGKFVKPPLKKVVKKEEKSLPTFGNTNKGEVSKTVDHRNDVESGKSITKQESCDVDATRAAANDETDVYLKTEEAIEHRQIQHDDEEEKEDTKSTNNLQPTDRQIDLAVESL